MSASQPHIAFLFDVDNTLLDNDRVIADLQAHLEHEVGTERALHYWRLFEELRAELGYADYLGALDVIEHVQQWGPAALLTDGDVVFQPRKVDRSGLSESVNGPVMIYLHKEQELDDVAKRCPAEHYVLVEDKLRLLAAIKKVWGSRVTTVFVRQGHYAVDPKNLAEYPAADVNLDSIGDLLQYRLAQLLNHDHLK